MTTSSEKSSSKARRARADVSSGGETISENIHEANFHCPNAYKWLTVRT